MKNYVRSLSYLAQFVQNEKCFRQMYSKSECTFYVQKRFFFFFENRSVYEIMWKTTVEPGRPHVTIWRMRIACWILKATNTHTHSKCVSLIAFRLQQCLHERTLMSHYSSFSALFMIILVRDLQHSRIYPLASCM